MKVPLVQVSEDIIVNLTYVIRIAKEENKLYITTTHGTITVEYSTPRDLLMVWHNFGGRTVEYPIANVGDVNDC